jgi:hypothetical protein
VTASTISTLQAQQQSLVKALFARPGETAARQALLPQLDTSGAQTQRGLQAYQANGHAVAERSLRAAYPVIDMMLGGDSFNALARDLWQRHPPARGDLALWGQALPVLLSSSTQLVDVPYLADVARVEWALHRAAFAVDAQPDPASFARLAAEDPDTLTLTLAPGTEVIASRFPIASLVLAHRHENPTLQEAARRLQQGQAESAVVWRCGLKPEIAPCAGPAASLMRCLLQGNNLNSAIDAALGCDLPDTEAFDFSAWLTQAVTRQLVIGVQDVPRCEADTLSPTGTMS